MNQQISVGRRVIGWKVGFGAPAAMARLNLKAPLIGYMLDCGVLQPGARAAFADWANPVAESELCVEMAVDLEANASEAEAAAAIGALGPAIELVDLSPPPENPEPILGGNIFHRHVVFGKRDPDRRGGKLSGLVGVTRLNGEVKATTTDLEANTGRIPTIVKHVADTLAELGLALKAGHVIICGSVIPPMPLPADIRSFEFDLQPIGKAIYGAIDHPTESENRGISPSVTYEVS